MPKLDHRGGSDDAPNAWRNVLRRAGELGLTVDVEKKIVSPVRDQLMDHPFVFMHGRSSFFFKRDEVEALKQYLEGGNRGLFLPTRFVPAIRSTTLSKKRLPESFLTAN